MGNFNEQPPSGDGPISKIFKKVNPGFKGRPLSKIDHDREEAIRKSMEGLGEVSGTHKPSSPEDKKSKFQVINGGKPEKLKTLPDNRI
ncbi:MAG: hypothetical protein WCV70_03700 [Patescibacteria group bacterium]|jgi:hypothetical protein